MVLGGIQESVTEIECGLEDRHNHVETLVLVNAEEVAIATFFMIVKIMRIVGKIRAGKMELLDILFPKTVETILSRVADLMKLVLILQREGVEWEHHASLCMTILMDMVKFLWMN